MPIRGTICSYLFVASGQQNCWNFVMRTSIPNCLEISNTLHVQHVSKDDLLLMNWEN
uniref:Uncharacterized protein n=1 Tax=Vitis vinifera TaxID=29760 RepID=F6HJM2_VITVI